MSGNLFTIPDSSSEVVQRHARQHGAKPDHIVHEAVQVYGQLLDESWSGRQIKIEDPRTGQQRLYVLRRGAPDIPVRQTFEKFLRDRPALWFLVLVWLWSAITFGVGSIVLVLSGMLWEQFWPVARMMYGTSLILSLLMAASVQLAAKHQTRTASKE